MLLDHLVTKWLETNRLKVQPQRCIRMRNRFSTCQKCKDACPVSAISLDNGLSVKEDLCTGCMRCTVNCPSEALYDEKYAEFFKEMCNREVIAFSCENDKREIPNIMLGCLFQLDKLLLLNASRNSNKIIIQYDEKRCGKCKKYNGELKSSIEKVIADLNSMLKTPINIEYNEIDSYKMERNYTRRELFTFFSQKMTRNVVTPLINDEVEARNLRESIKSGMKRETTHYLIKKHQEVFVEMQEIQNLNTIQLVFNENCDGCMVCEKVCPTGALKFTDDEEMTIANFDIQKCNGCKSCIDICRKNALNQDDTVQINLSSYLNGEKHEILLTKEIA